MKTKIYQKKTSERHDNSFWYDGLIAERGGLKLFAVGDIRILDKNGELVCDRVKVRGDGIKLVDDRDLDAIDDEEYYWDMNNWFSIEDENGEYGMFCGWAFYSYDEALDTLKSIDLCKVCGLPREEDGGCACTDLKL